jgi:hypothetical protein
MATEKLKLQQGDVLIYQLDEDVEKKATESLNHKTLAEGEATGHHHSIVSGVAKLFMINSILHAKVESDEAVLRHQEHDEIKLPKGNFRIGIVQEYDHFEEEARRVAD